MQEKIIALEAFIAMIITGLLIGLGKTLVSPEKLTVRVVLGRALVSTGLALVAGIILIQMPYIGLIPLIGVSALCASLGTSALERLVQHFTGMKK